MRAAEDARRAEVDRRMPTLEQMNEPRAVYDRWRATRPHWATDAAEYAESGPSPTRGFRSGPEGSVSLAAADKFRTWRAIDGADG